MIKLNIKLTSGFLFIAFLIVFVGFFGIFTNTTIQKNNEIVIELIELENLLDDSLVQVLQLIGTENLNDYNEVKSNIENIRKEFDVLHEKHDETIDLASVSFDENVADFTKISNGIIAIHKGKLILNRELMEKKDLGRSVQELEEISIEQKNIEANELLKISELRGVIDRLEDTEQTLINNIRSENKLLVKNTRLTLFIVVLVTFVLSILLGLYISRSLSKVDIMKTEFMNVAAHELKTPLVPLKSYLNIIKKNPKKFGLNQQAQGYVEICLRNTDRLEKLAMDILDISKLEAEEMKFNMKNVNLINLLNNTIKDLSSLAKEKNLILNTEIPKTLPTVYGDSQRLTQVISNLIKNATKFTNKGSITINAKLVKNNIQVDIIDTGMGIKKQNMTKLFIKFFQAQEVATRKLTGTGLGLAICKKIIEYHKGKIWAESDGLRKGSKFSFTLPIKK